MPDVIMRPPPELAWCSHCANRIHPDQVAYFCDEHDAWRCRACGPCQDDDMDSRFARQYGSAVHAWNYRPRHFRPKGDWRGGEPLLGVELEVGGRRAAIITDVVHAVDSSEDHLYMKEDGSISGVEIVTHPMTLAWARQYPFDTLLAGLRRVRCRVDDRYGLHVHVSRNAFRRKGKQCRPHQMMWLLFMYRNVDQLTKLARRTNTRYAAFAKPADGELRRKATGFIHYGDSRYVAVNCNNERTFELRFFKATLKAREFYAALEFADASVRYTAGLNSRDVVRGHGLTWKHFTQWVERHNYRNLYAEIMGFPQPRAPRKPRPTSPAPEQHSEQPEPQASARRALRRLGCSPETPEAARFCRQCGTDTVDLAGFCRGCIGFVLPVL